MQVNQRDLEAIYLESWMRGLRIVVLNFACNLWTMTNMWDNRIK